MKNRYLLGIVFTSCLGYAVEHPLQLHLALVLPKPVCIASTISPNGTTRLKVYQADKNMFVRCSSVVPVTNPKTFCFLNSLKVWSKKLNIRIPKPVTAKVLESIPDHEHFEYHKPFHESFIPQYILETLNQHFPEYNKLTTAVNEQGFSIVFNDKDKNNIVYINNIIGGPPLLVVPKSVPDDPKKRIHLKISPEICKPGTIYSIGQEQDVSSVKDVREKLGHLYSKNIPQPLTVKTIFQKEYYYEIRYFSQRDVYHKYGSPWISEKFDYHKLLRNTTTLPEYVENTIQEYFSTYKRTENYIDDQGNIAVIFKDNNGNKILYGQDKNFPSILILPKVVPADPEDKVRLTIAPKLCQSPYIQDILIKKGQLHINNINLKEVCK